MCRNNCSVCVCVCVDSFFLPFSVGLCPSLVFLCRSLMHTSTHTPLSLSLSLSPCGNMSISKFLMYASTPTLSVSLVPKKLVTKFQPTFLKRALQVLFLDIPQSKTDIHYAALQLFFVVSLKLNRRLGKKRRRKRRS